MKRNRAEFGTAVAVVLAAALIILLPLKLYAQQEYMTAWKLIEAEAEKFSDRIKMNGKITSQDYAELSSAIGVTGAVCEIELTIERSAEDMGEFLEGIPGNAYTETFGNDFGEKEYTWEILEELSSSGEVSLNAGDSYTVTVRKLTKSVAERIGAIFADTQIRKGVYTTGGTAG